MIKNNNKKNSTDETQEEPIDSIPEISEIYETPLTKPENVSLKSKFNLPGPLTLTFCALTCGAKLLQDTLDPDKTLTQSLLQGIVTSIAVWGGYKIYKCVNNLKV